MDCIPFDVFIPDEKKFRLSTDGIVLGLFVAVIATNWIDADFAALAAFGAFAACVYFLIGTFWRKKPLEGTIAGTIKFCNDKIMVDEETISFDDIVEIDFLFSNYYRKLEPNGRRSFNPRFSQGVDNYVTYIDRAGDKYIVNFRLKTEAEHYELVPFVTLAVKAGKMPVSRAIELFGDKEFFI